MATVRLALLQLPIASTIFLTAASTFAAPPPPNVPAAVVEQPPPATPPTPPTPPTITVDDPLLAPIPAAPKILTTWQEAIQLIDSRSTDLRIAEEEVARAAGASRVALGRILPTVNASASLQHAPDQTNQPKGTTLFGVAAPFDFSQRGVSDSTSGSVTLSVPILRPREWYAYGTARESLEMAKLSVVDRRRLLITNVASAIVSVFTAERVSEINRIGLKTSLERLELTRRRARLGTATRLDVVRAEQDVTLATNTIIQSNEALRKAREALGLAMGADEPYGVSPNISLNAIENSVRTMCKVGKPEDRADIRAAQQQLEINKRQLTETRLGFLPTANVELTGSTGTNHRSTNYVFPPEADPALVAKFPPQEQPTNRNYAWSIRAVISIPIFDGGVRYGETAVNRAVKEQQEVRVEAATRQARLEITQANRAVEVAEQARANSESGRDLAKETARLTQVAYEAGTATSFELVDASRRQRETELDLVVKEFDVLKAKIAALLAAAVCEE